MNASVKRAALLQVFVLTTLVSTSQTPPCTGPLEDHIFGTHVRDRYRQTVASSDGNYLIFGEVLGVDGNIAGSTYGFNDVSVVKVTPTGSLLWSVVLGSGSNDHPVSIMAMPDGGCVVTIYDYSVSLPPRVIRLNGSGTELWENIADPSWLVWGTMYMTGTGTIMVVSASSQYPGGTELDPATGAVLATDPFEEGEMVIPTSDGGRLAMTRIIELTDDPIPSPNWAGIPGLAQIGSIGYLEHDAGLIKYDASGNVLWKRRFLSYGVEVPKDVMELPDGYVVLIESTASYSRPALGGDRSSPVPGAAGNEDIWLIRTDLSGNIIWERSFGSSAEDLAGSLLTDGSGDFIIAGSTRGMDGDVTEIPRGGLDGWLLKVDALGNKQWDKRWGGHRLDELVDVFPTAAGYLFFGASSSPRSGERDAPLVDILSSDWGTDFWMLSTHVGTAPTWYEDADMDGFGDPLQPFSACSQPPGHVANAWDCDPVVANAPDQHLGAPCSDGNIFTFPDRIIDGCTCYGSIPDFLFDNLTFHLIPDAQALSLSMEIFEDENVNVPLISRGPWPNGIAGVPIEEQFQLPPGKYTMRVHDAQGNGIANGGYSLLVNGKRILEADGIFQQVSEAPLGFELPMGQGSLTIGTCDRLDLLPTSTIIASPNNEVRERYDVISATSGYQFWIFDPHGGYSRRIYQSHRNPGKGSPPGPDACAHLKLNRIVTNPVPLFTLLNVRVRPRVDGSYGPFGPACTLKIDPYANICPTTQLVNQPGPNFSCNAQRVFGGSDKVVAFTVSGANKYQFQFSQPDEGYLRSITSKNNARLLNWTTLQPLCGTFTYEVRVRASFDNGQTWCPWGATCPLTMAHYGAGCTPVGGSVRSAIDEHAGTFSLYPNPASDHRFTLVLPATNDDGSLLLTVFDVYGAQVFRQRISTPAGTTNIAVELPATIAAGTYAVDVTGERDRWTTRLIVQ